MFEGSKPGDKVWVSVHRGGSFQTISAVGRKYFLVGRQQFRISDGTSTKGYSYPRVYTLEARAQILAVEKAKRELATFGVHFDYRTSTEKILIVYEALKLHLALT